MVFLGTNKSGSSRDAIKAAQELGYFTCLLTNRREQLQQRREYHDVHHMQYCNLENVDEIRESLHGLQERSLELKAIVSFIDPWCGIASQLALEFGLKAFSTEAIMTAMDKIKTHEALMDTPYVPKFFTYDQKEHYNIKEMIPVVIKSSDSTGSKDVYLCDSEQSYFRYSQTLLKKNSEDQILVEEYLNGPQYIVETLTIDGVVHIIAVIEQEISQINGHFIITGYKLCLNLTPVFKDKLRLVVERILDRLQLKDGACHLEMRYVHEEWKLIEINPRISGSGMNQLIKIGLGINLVEETLKLALGQEVNLEPKHYKHTFAEYIVVERPGTLLKVTGKQAAINSPGVEAVYVKPRKGSRLIPPISLGYRYAYVIATGETSEEAITQAKEAANKIEFQLIM